MGFPGHIRRNQPSAQVKQHHGSFRYTSHKYAVQITRAILLLYVNPLGPRHENKSGLTGFTIVHQSGTAFAVAPFDPNQDW